MTPYSFVNIAAVVRDVAAHPCGAAVTDTLLAVLGMDDDALVELDRRPSPMLVTAGATGRTGDGPPGALLGGSADLVHWARHQVLAPAWQDTGGVAVCRWPRALDHVADAIAGAWHGEPTRDWVRRRPPTTIDGDALHHLVRMLSAADPAALDRSADEMAKLRRDGWSWPAAMHDACWAIELTGRSRAAAVAQLAALQAVLAADSTPRPDLVAAVTMAVHATAVADVLPTASVITMCRPLLAHLTAATPGSVRRHGRGDG